MIGKRGTKEMSEKLIYTMDYASLVDLFVRAGLEISPDEPEPEGLLTCFELIDEVTGRRIGAAGIVYDLSLIHIWADALLRCRLLFLKKQLI